MAAREARNFPEGALRWIQASGTGAWNTGSAAISGLMGFIQPGAAYTSAQTVQTVMERGSAHHHKVTQQPPGTVTFAYLQAVTANKPDPAQSSGVSTKQIHLELKSTVTEDPTVTAQYIRWHNCVKESEGWAEAENGNVWTETYRWLSMVGPTASGYIA